MRASAKTKIAAVAGLTSLCGASLFVLVAPAGAQSEAEIAEFSANGDTVQSFTVPDGVTCLSIAAAGAQGGEGGDVEIQGPPRVTDTGPEGNEINLGGDGGNGALVTTTVEVTPGAVLDVIVGVQGGDGSDAFLVPFAPGPEGGPGLGGFADGADGGNASFADGGGGGGKTEVAPASDDSFLVVAGGGGGGGAGGLDGAGGGGGAAGTDGDSGDDGVGENTTNAGGGGGGTQTDPGLGGNNGQSQALRAQGVSTEGFEPAGDGDGSAGGEGGAGNSGGGGGGGGFFGGGGGGGGALGGGGGGGAGSSFASETSQIDDGTQAGDGSVLLSWIAGDDSCVQGTDVERPPAAEPVAVTPSFTG